MQLEFFCHGVFYGQVVLISTFFVMWVATMQLLNARYILSTSQQLLISSI